MVGAVVGRRVFEWRIACACGGDDVGLMQHEELELLAQCVLSATAFEGLAGGYLLGGGAGDGQVHRRQALLGVFDVGSGVVKEYDPAVGVGGLAVVLLE